MSNLSRLKLVAAKKPNQADPILQRRTKLSAKLLEQLELAKAAKDGLIYAPTRIKTITNADGERVQVTQPKRIKQWWFTEGKKILLQVRYGSKVLTLAGKNNTVECSDIDALVTALDTVNTAVLAGELDSQVEAVSGQIRGSFER